jgi:hypothetical protein
MVVRWPKDLSFRVLEFGEVDGSRVCEVDCVRTTDTPCPCQCMCDEVRRPMKGCLYVLSMMRSLRKKSRKPYLLLPFGIPFLESARFFLAESSTMFYNLHTEHQLFNSLAPFISCPFSTAN